MKNYEKDELRRQVRRLIGLGRTKNEIVVMLEFRGFKPQTIKRYYDALGRKDEN